MSLLGLGAAELSSLHLGGESVLGHWFRVMYLLEDGEHAGWNVSGCDAGRLSTRGSIYRLLLSCSPPHSVQVEISERLWKIK